MRSATSLHLRTAILLTGSLLAAACSSNGATTGAPAVEEATAIDDDELLLVASETMNGFASAWVSYVGSVVVDRQANASIADDLEAYHDPAMVTLDVAALTECVSAALDGLRTLGSEDLWEHSQWRDQASEFTAAAGSSRALTVAVLDEIVTEDYSGSVFSRVVVGLDGIVGHTVSADQAEGNAQHTTLVGCLAASSTPSAEAQTLLAEGIEGPAVDLPLVSVEATFSNLTGGSEVQSGGDDEAIVQRPGFPADEGDPELIESTGVNTWDLLTVDDPSAFVSVESLGRGAEEFIPSSKVGGYQAVPDAYLYRATFSDDTSIDIRVHPEIGSQAEADAEIQRYLVPLGQLPTVLRQDIGRFAVRVGANTATASQGEGMMVQTQNMDVRIAANRLEETLFHEAVHTSLDPVYAFQRSQEWLDAQAADGRWLATYGRENPDSEDLAETALYAFALQYHPDRFPAGAAELIRDRVPNRLSFFDSIFPPGEPWILGPDG